MVRLPKVSNFTDLIPLSVVEGVGVRYVGSPRELGEPDLVVIPGTKATIADLRWMRTCGLEAAILRRASSGTPVLGICGGYQMLGQEISDPMGTECGGSIRGMGLLPTRTVFDSNKRQVRSGGRLAQLDGPLAELSGVPVRGYQIHMGRTTAEGGRPFCTLEDEDGNQCADGCCQGNVYGTYLHGVFDSGPCAQALARALLRRKGLDPSDVRAVDLDAYRERQFDELARVVRENMDMDLVYRILEQGI